MNSPFDSPSLWIASPDHAVAQTIFAFLEPFLNERIPHRFDARHTLILRNGDELHRTLDEQNKQVLFNAACIVDLTGSATYFQFDLRADTRQVLRPTELIVRYPEVYWIFVVNSIPDWTTATKEFQSAGISPELLSLHFVEVTRLMDLVLRLREHASGFRTIFDPTGLRFLVLTSSNIARNQKNTISQLGLPSSDQLSHIRPRTFGVSLEDERGYAILNGYFLYKQGFSTFLIATLAEYRRSATYARYLASSIGTTQPRSWHAIEDVELCFSDTSGADLSQHHLMPAEGSDDVSMLAERTKSNPLLQKATTRLILTTVRLERVRLKVACGPNCESLTKPYRGLHDETLLAFLSNTEANSKRATESSLFRLGMNSNYLLIKQWVKTFFFRVGMIFEFSFFLFAPIHRFASLLTSALSNFANRLRQLIRRSGSQRQDTLPLIPHTPEHSAPGSIQEVAAHLLRRCKSASHVLTAPEDAIQCAVMANVAYLLLNKKTQHLALEALSLQNLMEAEAECMFIGISHSLNVNPRVIAIEDEVALVTSVKAKDDYAKFWKRHQQRCSALLKILGDLRHVYQRFDQREQEGDLLCAIRSWQRLAFINGKNEWINNCLTFRWIMGLIRCALSVLWGYINFLVGSSGRNLLVISAVWIFLFAGAYDILVNTVVGEHRRVQEWQSTHWITIDSNRSRVALPLTEMIHDLRVDYFSYWLPQSAATFVGMHQSLDGGLHPQLLSDYISKNAEDDHKRLIKDSATSSSPHIHYIRRLMKTWWFLVVCEMGIGYIHLAAAVTVMLAVFSRK